MLRMTDRIEAALGSTECIAVERRRRGRKGQREVVRERLVNWCSEPSQPLGIISGLKETFIKRHRVERTDEAEIRPEE